MPQRLTRARAAPDGRILAAAARGAAARHARLHFRQRRGAGSYMPRAKRSLRARSPLVGRLCGGQARLRAAGARRAQRAWLGCGAARALRDILSVVISAALVLGVLLVALRN